jgi:hypothetical protein
MNRERFGDLAQAYGGQIARWPEGERDAAALFAASEPAAAQAVLATASDLDAVLEAWAAPVADAGLREAIVASAPQPRRRPPLAAWAWRAGLGAGLAAACAAGVLVGVQLSPDAGGEEAVASAMNSFDSVAGEDT